MSYTITIRVYQTNPNAFFQIVEKTVWNYGNGGTWTESNGTQVLKMGSSGTSGTLRFQSSDGTDMFLIAIGIDGYKRWCDIVPNLRDNQTGTQLHPNYYNGTWDNLRQQDRPSVSVTDSKSHVLKVEFTSSDGNDLTANIVIG